LIVPALIVPALIVPALIVVVSVAAIRATPGKHSGATYTAGRIWPGRGKNLIARW
jgi:hypothetical protein